jgi:hypothetical protein
MATHIDIAGKLVHDYLHSEFVWEGEIVQLTGRYAAPIAPTGHQPTIQAIIGTIQVEVKIQDKDAPIVKWVDFKELKIVKDAVEK